MRSAKFARTLRRQPGSPTLNGLPLAQLIQSESEPPLNEIAKAIETNNNTDFIKAFKKLTEACNHCHQAAGIGFPRN
jgi:hypothetical protein